MPPARERGPHSPTRLRQPVAGHVLLGPPSTPAPAEPIAPGSVCTGVGSALSTPLTARRRAPGPEECLVLRGRGTPGSSERHLGAPDPLWRGIGARPMTSSVTSRIGRASVLGETGSPDGLRPSAPVHDATKLHDCLTTTWAARKAFNEKHPSAPPGTCGGSLIPLPRDGTARYPERQRGRGRRIVGTACDASTSTGWLPPQPVAPSHHRHSAPTSQAQPKGINGHEETRESTSFQGLSIWHIQRLQS